MLLTSIELKFTSSRHKQADSVITSCLAYMSGQKKRNTHAPQTFQSECSAGGQGGRDGSASRRSAAAGRADGARPVTHHVRGRRRPCRRLVLDLPPLQPRGLHHLLPPHFLILTSSTSLLGICFTAVNMMLILWAICAACRNNPHFHVICRLLRMVQ